MAGLELNAIAQHSALRAIDSLAAGIVISAFAFLFLRLSRRQDAGARFAVWFSALLAIAVLPLTVGLWPQSNVSAAVSLRPAFTFPESWAVYLFGIWAMGAGWSLLGVGKALWHLHEVRKSCVEVDPASLDTLIQKTFQRKRTRRPITLCTSEQVTVPTALGLVRPAIVVPRWVIEELPAAELNQVILHEMAHLRRWDDWTNLAQQIVRAGFFFHPAVWWIEKKVAFEREMACDEAVLAETRSPRAYAECLTHLAEKTFVQRGIALAQAALGRVSQVSRRVAQILDGNRVIGDSRAWKSAVVLVAGFAVICSVGVSRAPQLIAFEGSQPSSVSSSVSVDHFPEVKSAIVTQASLVVPQPAKVTLAKVNEIPGRTKSQQPPRSAALSSRGSRASDNLIHLSGLKAARVPVSQAVFVVIESSEQISPDGRFCEIQMWRMTVLHTVGDPSSKPPRKT